MENLITIYFPVNNQQKDCRMRICKIIYIYYTIPNGMPLMISTAIDIEHPLSTTLRNMEIHWSSDRE